VKLAFQILYVKLIVLLLIRIINYALNIKKTLLVLSNHQTAGYQTPNILHF